MCFVVSHLGCTCELLTSGHPLCNTVLMRTNTVQVIFPDPGFPAYSNLAKVTGATPVPVRLNPDNTCFDPEALAKAFTANTRAIIVNSPSNPTGGVATEAQLMEIAELVKKWPNVWVFSDEIYSELVYAGGLAPSFLTVRCLCIRAPLRCSPPWGLCRLVFPMVDLSWAAFAKCCSCFVIVDSLPPSIRYTDLRLAAADGRGNGASGPHCGV